MTGGEAEAARIPTRCWSIEGSRRRASVCGLARRAAESWRAAMAAGSWLGGPLRVPATAGGEAGFAGGSTVWISRWTG
jgi:hypothetical protein